MAHKENQRIALTRRLLQEGLLRLLATNNLDDISVTALCKEAGINRATFYNHYTAPSALLYEMEQTLVAELKEINKPAKSLEQILDQLERSCIHLKENTALIQILVKFHADDDLEDIVKALARHYDEYRLDSSGTHFDPDTMRLVSVYLYAGCYQLIREWVVSDIDKTPKEIAELLVSLVSKKYL